jgi:hypothetical protein
MKLIFGFKTFKLKTFTDEDLNLKGQVIEDILFEVRQQYFHVYLIPFFSTKKLYIEIRNKEPYPMDPRYVDLINSSNTFKTPWYSFAGWLLIPLILLIYSGIELSNYYEKSQWTQKEFNNNIEQIDNPTINDYYHLFIYDDEDRNNYIVKVDDFNNDSILIKIPTKHDQFYVSEEEIIDYFDDIEYNYKKEWFLKKEIKTTIENKFNKFEGVTIERILGKKNFKINRIYRIK